MQSRGLNYRDPTIRGPPITEPGHSLCPCRPTIPSVTSNFEGLRVRRGLCSFNGVRNDNLPQVCPNSATYGVTHCDMLPSSATLLCGRPLRLPVVQGVN